MERRRFLESCAAVSGAAAIGSLQHAWASAPPRLYERAHLVDRFGARPIILVGLPLYPLFHRKSGAASLADSN